MNPSSQSRLSIAEVLTFILIAIVIGFYVLMVGKFAINVPRMDDYIQFLGYHHYFPENGNLQEKLTALFSQPRWEHGPESDHRIIIARIAMFLSEALLGEIDFWLITVFGNLLFLLWFIGLWRNTPVSANPVAMLPVVFLLFSFVHYEIAFWSSAALLYYPVTFFTFAAISLAFKPKALPGIAGSIASGILAAGAQANGLLALPTVAGGLAVRNRRNLAILFAIVAAMIFGLYFHGYKRPGVIPAFPDPLKTAELVISAGLRLLGSSFGSLWPWATGFVILGWAGLLWKRYWRINPTFFWFAVWLLLSMATIAVGRASFGAESVMVSRYRFYSLALLAIMYLAILELLGKHWLRRYVIGAGLAAALFLYADETPRNLRLAENERVDVLHGANFYRIEGLGPFSYGGFPEATMANGLIREMESKNLYHIPDFSEHMAREVIPKSHWKFDGDPLEAGFLALHGAGKTLSVKGYANLEGGRCDNIETFVVLAQEVQRHYYTTEALSRAKWRESVFKPCLEFAAFIDVRPLPVGNYRIGVVRVYQDGSVTEFIAPPPTLFVKVTGQE